MNTVKNDGLKIISLNIEQDKHFDRVIPFIKAQQSDIVLLQEVFDKHRAFLEKELGMTSFFAMLNTFVEVENSNFGIVTLTSLPVTKTSNQYYRGNATHFPSIRAGAGEAANMARALLVTEFVKGNQNYCAINTHFTWTPDGRPSDKQYQDVDIMLQQLAQIPEFVLCGDFNAPRGKAIFDKIAAQYKDNIPQHITTTIDKNLHKAGDLNLVVDGMFTTPRYQVGSIEVIDGLSDHYGLVATIHTL